MLKWQFLSTPVGLLKIIEEDGFITEVYPVNESVISSEQTSQLLKNACKQLEEYFCGNRKSFDLPIKLHATAFEKQVWEQLKKIPYGQTRTYQEIAVAIGNEKAARAVGQANNKNRIIIIIPCHRVVNKNGTSGGFSYGTQMKNYLLNLEKCNK
jgi:methylated-DNA-[protein]-cysteine S-methyltransferase